MHLQVQPNMNRSSIVRLFEVCRASRPGLLTMFAMSSVRYRFSCDVTAAIFVFQGNEMAAVLVSLFNPMGLWLYSYSNASYIVLNSNMADGHVSEDRHNSYLDFVHF